MKAQALLIAIALALASACTKAQPSHSVGVPPASQTTDPRGTTYTNTAVMTAPANGSWSVAQWYQSYALGSDTNDCLTSSTPCASIAEIQRRWGGDPVLAQATTITPLDTPTTAQALADPWNIHAKVTKGGNLTIKGLLNAANKTCSGTLNTVTAKNRGTGTPLKSTFTLTSSDGGTCTIAAGLFVSNTTHAANAWVHHLVTGTTWLLTQPMGAPANPFQLAWPAEVDTWVTTDAVSFYTPTAINLVAFDVVPTDPQTNGVSNQTALYGQLLDIAVLDPQSNDAGIFLDPVTLGPYVHVLETWSNRPVMFNGEGVGTSAIVNSGMAGGLANTVSRTNLSGPNSANFNSQVVYGGAIGSSFASTNDFEGAVLDGDTVISGTVNAANTSLGLVYVDTSATLNLVGLADVANHAVNAGTLYDVYGAGTLNVAGSSRLVYALGAGKAVGTFGDASITTTANSTTSTCYQRSDAGQVCAQTLSPANLDTNLGAVFGCQFAIQGGAFCNSSP